MFAAAGHNAKDTQQDLQVEQTPVTKVRCGEAGSATYQKKVETLRNGTVNNETGAGHAFRGMVVERWGEGEEVFTRDTRASCTHDPAAVQQASWPALLAGSYRRTDGAGNGTSSSDELRLSSSSLAAFEAAGLLPAPSSVRAACSTSSAG